MLTKPFLIRAATRDDIDGIAEVLVEGWKWAYRDILTEDELANQQVSTRAERIRQTWRPETLTLIAVDDAGRVAGTTREQIPPGLQGYDAEIGTLYVHPDYARQGIGEALVKAIVEHMVSRTATSLCIHTFRDNMIGRRFYEKLGGVVVGESLCYEYPSVWFGWPDIRVLL